MKSLKTGFAFCLVLALMATPALAGDLIQKTTGKWFPAGPEDGSDPGSEDFEKSNITVTDEDYDFVYYKYEGVSGRQKEPTARVKRVLYQKRPERFLTANDLMSSGKYADALKEFDEIAKNKRAFPESWVRMYSLFNMGRIYQEGLYDYANAVAAWDRLQREFKKSKFLPKSIVQKGLAFLALGQEDDAKKAFLSLERLPGLPEGKKKIAKYYLIKIVQMKGEKGGGRAMIEEALGKYRELLKEVEGEAELTEVAILARLGIGDCLLSLEKFGEALAFFQKIAASSDDPNVLAGAYNGLGRCHYEKREWNEALYSFLRVVILYNENAGQTAMALYYSAKSYSLRKGDEWKERTRELYRECIAKFPNTTWGRKSKEELPSIR